MLATSFNKDLKLTPNEIRTLVRHELGDVIVAGIYGKKVINKRCLINADKDKNGEKKYLLQVEGDCLIQVMAVPQIDPLKVTSNNVKSIEKLLGIEAARKTIINEVQKIMDHHGIKVDNRHVMLLSDIMCSSGSIIALTRHGLKRSKSSALMLASFEQTEDHLLKAAVQHRTDLLQGVSERIIVGQQIHLGTGSVQMWQK